MMNPRNFPLIIILVVIIFFFAPFGDAGAQEGETIQVLNTEIENNYPDGLTFYISLKSTSPITSIKLYFQLQGSNSRRSQPVEFEPAEEVQASYNWDTSRQTIAPSTPLTYSWQITDENGNTLKTEDTLIYYDDLRFDWQELSTPDLILRWYEGDQGFGDRVFSIAQLSLAQMKENASLELEFPVIILLYANQDDFNSWHFYAHDWIGGQAFPSLGVTAQIVPETTSQSWLEGVIPHEIAHLFFYQAIKDSISSYPRWFNEGLAQYYEFTDNQAAIERVVETAKAGGLLPLVLISGDFGSDPEKAYLAYDQSYAAVVYLIETWGFGGLQAVITNISQDMGYREAFENALGVTWEAFEAGWITWLGVPTTPVPPPTATPTLVYLKAPDGWPTPTRASTPAIIPSLTYLPEKLPPANTLPPPTPKPVPQASVPGGLPISIYLCLAGLICFGSLIVLAVVFFRIRRSDNLQDG